MIEHQVGKEHNFEVFAFAYSIFELLDWKQLNTYLQSCSGISAFRFVFIWNREKNANYWQKPIEIR